MLIALDELKQRRNEMDSLIRQAFELGMFSEQGHAKLKEASEILEKHQQLEKDVVYKKLRSGTEDMEFFKKVDDEIIELRDVARMFYLESLDSEQKQSLEDKFLLALEVLLLRMNQKERLLAPIYGGRIGA